MPCSIDASDCANLYRSYSTVAASLIGVNTTVSAPPCVTNGSNSVPFSTTSCSYGGVVGVRGSAVRLLYWPVRTASSAYSEYFCTQSRYSNALASPMTIAGTPTGSGPNTFVTGTLTITSPTVALSYAGLSRLDGCGTTIEHTIITMRPDELSSVRGGRSLYDLRPFNFGDMNWMCPSPNNSSQFTVQDIEGPNCYQNVPAQAYWNAAQQFDLALYANISEIQHWTILNNYQPYVLPAQSVWSETLQSLWGSTALWYIDGSWDPPIALSEAASVAKPTFPASLSATPTADVSTSTATAISTTPTPAQLSDTLPSSTAGPQATIITIPTSSSADESRYPIPSTDDTPSPTSSSQEYSQSTISPGGSKLIIGTKAIAVMWTSASSLLDPMAVLDSETLSVGGPAGTISGHIVSAATNGLAVDIQGVSTASVLTLTHHTASDGVVLLQNDQTTIALTPGGAAATINSQVLSAASTGLVGDLDFSPDLIRAGGMTFSEHTASGGMAVLENHETTVSLFPSGSAVTIQSQVLSAASTGLEVFTHTSESASITLISMSTSSLQSQSTNTASRTAVETSLPDSGASFLSVHVVIMLVASILATIVWRT